MISSIITIFLYVNTSWMWMSQQIIPPYREKNYVCATNRSPEVFHVQLLDQNVAMQAFHLPSAQPSENTQKTQKKTLPNHYPPWLDWKGSEFHHKKVQPKVQVCRGPGIGRDLHFHADRRPRRPRRLRRSRGRAAGGATAWIFGVATPGPG